MHPQILPESLRPYADLIFGITAAILILILGWIASKWANRLLLKLFRRRQVDESLARFLAALAQYTVLAMGVIAALGKVGVETTSVVAIFASAGLAIGLALQGSLSNFASGVLLLLFRPLTIGDTVTVGGHLGTVEEIGLFATTLVTPGNEMVVVPNAAVTGGSIVNHTCRGTRRGKVEIGVAYGTSIEVATSALQRAADRTALILRDPAPAVVFVGFGASSLDFVVAGSSKSGDYLAMLHNLRVAIYEELNAAKIDIPFPQMVVHKAS
ncbi:MAG: mechanosensitive ion channel [Myxococcales bacterium]|nr:mechanosensitive ion channel [Myxococcales bacterium]MCB9568770.1 mechanosensitive ion channel [Myxococcales bacterium]MCB9706580.1 mechanosensitive ion channel [Myxococcales bacterium]